MRPPFYSPEFLQALACSWGGRVVSHEPLPLIEKGFWFLRRAYSLPYGLYGGFVHSPDYDLVRFLSMRYLRFAIVDFGNTMDPRMVPYMGVRRLTTHILTIPESMDSYLASLKKKRRRSLQNMMNRMRKLGVEISLSSVWLPDFYEVYRATSRSRPLSMSSIKCMENHTLLVSAVRRGKFLGGVLVLWSGDYALLWLAGWRKVMQLSEYLYYSSIRVAMERGIRYMDFGASHTQGVRWFKESMGGNPHTYQVFESRKV